MVNARAKEKLVTRFGWVLAVQWVLAQHTRLLLLVFVSALSLALLRLALLARRPVLLRAPPCRLWCRLRCTGGCRGGER